MSNRNFSNWLILVILSLFCISTNLVSAQDCSQAWKQKYPGPRGSTAVAYDTQRNRLVVFGGETQQLVDNTTWEWDGVRWEQKSTTGPTARAGHQMVYDSLRGVVVLFGGSATDETWEWDGSVWSQRNSVHKPSPRSYHSMAYDSTRHVVVLFGGWTAPSYALSDETWEWDGNDWTLREPPSRPTARNTAGMSFDTARGVTVLFGGNNGSGSSDETWEWNGTDWIQRVSDHKPGAADRRTMAYDPIRHVTVLLSLTYSSGWYPETWEWNGIDWIQRATAVSPGARDWPALAYDAAAQRVVVFGGFDYQEGSYVGGLWEWDNVGESWQEKSALPTWRAYQSMAYDSARNRTVLYGGGKLSTYSTTLLGDTWEENGTEWIKREPVTNPPTLLSHSMTYDSARGVTVLFGGWPGSGNYSNQTWEWNGTNWSQATPTESPPARGDAAMAFDAARNETVLFGGLDSTGTTLGDTWVYNGTTWTQKFPSHSPSARIYASIAYDSARQVVVLYGGSGGLTDLSTWEWNGIDWIEVPTIPNPGNRIQAFMAYSPDLARVLLAAGGLAGGADNSTLTWNGSSWLNPQVGSTPNRASTVMVYDIARHQALFFGGQAPGSFGTAETWTLDAVDSDLDGTLDCSDQCPNDPEKIASGICGCGISDNDDDGDLTANCNESCDLDPLKLSPGVCGCGTADTDSDLDGTPNCTDLCSSDPQKTSGGACGCGIADADTDQDQTPNCQDLCPADPDKISAGVCGCGISDADTNGNSVLDCLDAGITSLTPVAPKLKLKKKLTSVEMTSVQGVKYVIKYRWLTGTKAKDKKIKYKTIIAAAPSLLLKGAKIGLTLALSYHYLVEGSTVYQSVQSKEVKLKVKRFPKK